MTMSGGDCDQIKVNGGHKHSKGADELIQQAYSRRQRNPSQAKTAVTGAKSLLAQQVYQGTKSLITNQKMGSRSRSRVRNDAISVGRRPKTGLNKSESRSPLKDHQKNGTNKTDLSWADDKSKEIIKYFKKFNLKKDSEDDKVPSKFFPDAYPMPQKLLILLQTHDDID